MTLLPNLWVWYNHPRVMIVIENFDSILAASLQLEEAWYVSGVLFDAEKQQRDIWVRIRKSAVFVCPRYKSNAMVMSRMNDSHPCNIWVKVI